MANKKITELPSLTGASAVSADLIPVVDVSADITSSMTRGQFFTNVPALSMTGSFTSDNVDITGGAITNVTVTGGTISGTTISSLATPLTIAQGGTGQNTASGARTNLGLGTVATQNAYAIAITGGAIDNTPIGDTTRSSVKATTLNVNGDAVLGFSSANTVLLNSIMGIGLAPVSGKGLLQVGTINYTDSNILAAFASSSASTYNQMILQNTSGGTQASTNYNVSNNLATSTTNFGEFGMNSSGFGGFGPFGANGVVYLASASTDLVIGTYGTNAIHFAVNGVSTSTDAMTISGTGVISGTGITNLFASPPAIGATAASTARFTSLVTNGDIYVNQPAQTSKSAAATLTIAELLTNIIQYTGALATLTLPLGTSIEAGVITSLPVDGAFDFSVINTGTGVVTLGANGNTTVGSMAVTNATSGLFRVRKTATSTYTVYRIS